MAEREEIEITPEMVEAGVDTLNDFEYDNWMPDRGAAVRAIYVVMQSLASSLSPDSTLCNWCNAPLTRQRLDTAPQPPRTHPNPKVDPLP